MRFPKRIQPLIDDGLVDEVLRQLMSGKEATVYVVRCGQEIRCAKIYKEAYKRSFKKAVQYQEGRKQRNSRRARAIEKAPSLAGISRKNPGRMLKSMRSIVSVMQACAYPKPTAALRAYYLWRWWSMVKVRSRRVSTMFP